MLSRLTRSFLFILTSLTILPGCQQLSHFRDAQARRRPEAGFSTAICEECSQTQTKSIPREEPSIVGTVSQQPTKPEPSEPKPRLEETPGVITIGELERGKGPEPTAPAQLPDLKPRPEPDNYSAGVKALQSMLDGRHEEAIRHLRGYDEDTQEFLLRLLPPLTLFLKKSISDMTPQEVGVLIEQMDRLKDTIRARSELVVTKMCCCKRIMNYGWYEELPANHPFLTGTDKRPGELVQLYVELKNFACEPTKDGDYVTRLAVALELANGKGEKVWSHSFDKKDTTPRRRTRLNDFYSGYSFYVPALPPGTYQLTIQVADETIAGQRRTASKSIDFHVTPVANHTTLRP